MTLDLMHMNLVVKNTFLEFDLKQSAWQIDNSSRRASVGAMFAGGVQGKESGRSDNCDVESGSTTGSDRQSLSESLENDSLADADLEGDASNVQPFYSSEWDDWGMPSATEDMLLPVLQQIQPSIPSFSVECAAQYNAPLMQTLEPYPFYHQTSPTCFEMQPTFFSITPNTKLELDPAVLGTSGLHEQKRPSQPPTYNGDSRCDTETWFAQISEDSRQHAKSSLSPRRRQRPERIGEPPFMQTSVDAHQHESLSRSPCRKQLSDGSSFSSRQAESEYANHQDNLSQSPRRKQLSERSSPGGQLAETEYTTVMLRNVPNDYTRDMLVDLLRSRGFGNSYDFLYLPFDFKRGAGLGYAFVNMITHKEAKRAMEDLAGFRNWKLRSSKVLQLTWSTPLQGLLANIERYRNSPVMHPDVPEQFKPLLISDGVPVDFPAPTKPLPTPTPAQN